MYILALECTTSSTLRVFFIVKVIIAVILILVPVMTVITTMYELTKKIFSNEVGRETIGIVLKKLVMCMMVLLVIPIHNTILNAFEENSIESTSCWINANKEYIDALKIQEEEKRAAAKEADRLAQEAKYQEYLKMQEEFEKLEAKNEEKYEQSSDNNGSNNNDSNNDNSNGGGNNTPSYDGSSENGKWGLLTVKNGVFYLPDRRATSNKDTPVQEGKHGLNPIFWNRLNNLIKDAAKVGCKVTVSSGHRSYSKQLSTWNNNHRPCPERCSWVAYPGGSRHNFGIAADLKYNGSGCTEDNYHCNSCARWVHNNASKYGLKFRLSNEPWHIEPAQVKGGSYKSCRSICKTKI